MVRLTTWQQGHGLAALSAGVEGLLRGNHPVRCGVYIGLNTPGPDSSHHAHATEMLARIVTGHEPDFRYRFNSKPAPTTRVFSVASRGRADGISADLPAFPRDLASPLWQEVEHWLAADADTAAPHLREAASELMLRLGYVRTAASLVGLSPAIYDQPNLAIDADDISVDDAIGQFHVLSRMHRDQGALAEAYFMGGFDRRFSRYVRTILLKAFIVHYGGSKTWDDRLPAARTELLALLDDLDLAPFHASLYAQTVYRAVAFIPFLRRDVDATFDDLARAERHQYDAVPRSELDHLLWTEHCFPLIETLYRTNQLTGSPKDALAQAERLVVLSPGDNRSWLARATARAELDELDGALTDFDRAISFGGRTVAAAAFGAHQVARETGDPHRARTYLAAAHEVDPCSSSLVGLVDDPITVGS